MPLPLTLLENLKKKKERKELNLLDLCMETRLCNFGKTQTTISNSRSLRLKELKNPYSEFSSVFYMDDLKESLGNLHMLFKHVHSDSQQ